MALLNQSVKLYKKKQLEVLPLPMQYMGGKGRIVKSILDDITCHFEGTTRFIDLFAGSGVVSFHAKTMGYQVSANDIQPYSSAVLSSLISTPTNGLEKLITRLENITDNEIFSGSRGNYLSDYLCEKSHIRLLKAGSFDWERYREFCEETKLFSGMQADIEILKTEESWSLFLAYYRNTYFGIRQCAEIDFLRELCENVDENINRHLMASVISSLTYCVSSTTHLAQYLKPTTEKNSVNLLKRRSLHVIEHVIKRLKLLLSTSSLKNGEVMNVDFREALEHFDLDSSCVVYADPPYFKEHYSRYYHVLDTFVLYDYPELTYNKRLCGTTKGRYRENRIVSDFGKKSLVRAAFNDLYESCIRYGNKLAISYACSSLVEKDFFYNLAKEKELDIKVCEFELTHTGQGQARHKDVTEYLFLISKRK